MNTCTMNKPILNTCPYSCAYIFPASETIPFGFQKRFGSHIAIPRAEYIFPISKSCKFIIAVTTENLGLVHGSDRDPSLPKCVTVSCIMTDDEGCLIQCEHAQCRIKGPISYGAMLNHYFEFAAQYNSVALLNVRRTLADSKNYIHTRAAIMIRPDSQSPYVEYRDYLSK